MAQLEDITKDTTVKGILPNASVTIVDAKWHGSDVLEAVYKGPDGSLGNELLFRDREPTLEVVEAGRPWSFTGDGSLSASNNRKFTCILGSKLIWRKRAI